MLPAIPFYVIRHGESVANLGQYTSGHVDVELTETGLQQARDAAKIVAQLELKPTVIVHSHLQRAKKTAEILNEVLNVPMIEEPLIAEQFFGEWEGVSWEVTRQLIRDCVDPPKGETHPDFYERVKNVITKFVNEQKGPVMFVCHGGVFRAIGGLHGTQMVGVHNCALHYFEPMEHESFPWAVKKF